MARAKQKDSNSKRTADSRDPLAMEEVFKSEDEMADALEAIARFFRQRYDARSIKDEQIDARGFSLRRLRVVFTDKVERIEFESDFADGTGVIYAPAIANATKEELSERSDAIIRFYAPIIKESQIAIALRLYQSLDHMARSLFRRKYSPPRKERRRMAPAD